MSNARKQIIFYARKQVNYARKNRLSYKKAGRFTKKRSLHKKAVCILNLRSLKKKKSRSFYRRETNRRGGLSVRISDISIVSNNRRIAKTLRVMLKDNINIG